MTELRKCSRCNSNINISYFGKNRKKELYKTCKNCRKNKMPSHSKKEITPEHYEAVDKDLREKYEKEFNQSSRDTSYGFYSREQQIERYAKIMAFWDKNMPGSISNFDLEKFDPYLTAK